MKIIGFSAGVVGRESNVDRMVKSVMQNTGWEAEFVKLTDLSYSSCKGCSWLCARPQVCQLEDELLPHVLKIKDVDAVVLGSPVHGGTISAAMHSFISRLWGYRHVNLVLRNKPFVLLLSAAGHRQTDTSPDDFRRALRTHGVNIVDVITYPSSIPPCYRCGRHQECSIGGAYRIWGEKAHSLAITPGLFSKWEDIPEMVDSIKASAGKLKKLLEP